MASEEVRCLKHGQFFCFICNKKEPEPMKDQNAEVEELATHVVIFKKRNIYTGAGELSMTMRALFDLYADKMGYVPKNVSKESAEVISINKIDELAKNIAPNSSAGRFYADIKRLKSKDNNMGILLSKEIEDLAHELFHIHHTKNLKWNNCSQDLRQWYLLEADHLIRDLGYSKKQNAKNQELVYEELGDKLSALNYDYREICIIKEALEKLGIKKFSLPNNQVKGISVEEIDWPKEWITSDDESVISHEENMRRRYKNEAIQACKEAYVRAIHDLIHKGEK